MNAVLVLDALDLSLRLVLVLFCVFGISFSFPE